MKKLKATILIIALWGILIPTFSFADSFGEKHTFYIDPTYDIASREKISATLRHISLKGYFYLEDEWWEDLSQEEKTSILEAINELAQEFDQTIYPILTSTYGSEWRPGIDKDYRITILIHQMKEKVGGYIRSIDEYYKIQAPQSNQREMIYLNADYIDAPLMKSYLAHEFTHLITFNQKEKRHQTQEEIWLNEARSDYSPAILGYDKEEISPLQDRIKYFLSSPSDSILKWDNKLKDYGIVNIFTYYLVDHYGLQILKDSLYTSKQGVEAINFALERNGYKKTMQEIFVDWSIAVFLNDCDFGKEYCYQNSLLSNLKVTPSLIYLPSTQKTNLSLVYNIWDWSARWFKIIGGNKGLEIKIIAPKDVNFHLPYVVFKNSTQVELKFLTLENGVGKIKLPKFAKENTSIVLIPSVTEALHEENVKKYTFTIQITSLESSQTLNLEELKAQILEIQRKILEIQRLLQMRQKEQQFCSKITKNLYYGLRNDPHVRCLQEFLKSQGPEIYPEGLVTGNFLDLTYRAVIRFQEKYKEEILEPLGLHHGTGFVGPKTRAKINQLLNASSYFSSR